MTRCVQVGGVVAPVSGPIMGHVVIADRDTGSHMYDPSRPVDPEGPDMRKWLSAYTEDAFKAWEYRLLHLTRAQIVRAYLSEVR